MRLKNASLFFLPQFFLLQLFTGCGGVPYSQDVGILDFHALGLTSLFSLDGALTLRLSLRSDKKLELHADPDCRDRAIATYSAQELENGVQLPTLATPRVAYSTVVKTGAGFSSPCQPNSIQYSNVAWTWTMGSGTAPRAASYGTVGVPASTNYPPVRSFPNAWADSAGNFWIFGGNGASWGDLNDLWKFDPATHYWTWISGSNASRDAGNFGTLGLADSANSPAARAANPYWIGADNNLYVFSGYTTAPAGSGAVLHDFWKYDVRNNVWTWIGGTQTKNVAATYGSLGVEASANTPGSRFNSVQWTDSSGTLWLYGGYTNAHYYGDLWKFDLNSLQWTWESGGAGFDVNAQATSVGVPSATDFPGARAGSCAWKDTDGNFWLFGGQGVGSSGTTFGYLQDIWRYRPSEGHWTWVAGATTVNPSGTYGTRGVAAPGNAPGGRRQPSCFTDSAGRLWVFGGSGRDSLGTLGELNDLWVFNPVTSLWTWMSGSTFADQNGVYETVNSLSFTTIPGGRHDATAVSMPNGEAWFFGGYGRAATGGVVKLNDMWKLPIP